MGLCAALVSWAAPSGLRSFARFDPSGGPASTRVRPATEGSPWAWIVGETKARPHVAQDVAERRLSVPQRLQCLLRGSGTVEWVGSGVELGLWPGVVCDRATPHASQNVAERRLPTLQPLQCLLRRSSGTVGWVGSGVETGLWFGVTWNRSAPHPSQDVAERRLSTPQRLQYLLRASSAEILASTDWGS